MSNQRDLSFACFNLYNLHLPGQRIYSNTQGWSQAAFEAKLAWTARQLQQLDADVIAFQECWSLEALRACFRVAGLEDAYTIVGRDTQPPGIQVALAVRNTHAVVGQPEWIEAFPEGVVFEHLREAFDATESVSVTIRRFSRPPLRVTIQPRGTRPKPPPVDVYVLHLKSKGPTSLSGRAPRPAVQVEHTMVARSVVSHVRRIVEAGALRALLDTRMKGKDAPVVVIGDLNDGTPSISTELLSGTPGYRFFHKSRAGSRSQAGLYSVELLQQLRSFRDVYYTYLHQQKMESLDHILVSDAFYDHSESRRWSFREMTVFNDHVGLSKAATERLGATDHGLIRAQFDWNPMSAVLAAP